MGADSPPTGRLANQGSALKALFEPASVAVVGASASPEKRGYQILRALVEGTFAGRVIPVNPKGGTLLGLDVAPSLDSVRPVPDLVVVALPAAAVIEVLEQAAALGVRAAIVLAVGFGESGPEGAVRERRLAEIAQSTGMRILGPNTSGVFNTHTGLNLIGTPGVATGPVAVVTQSGNVALHLMRSLTAAGSGISICLGVGNQVDIGFADPILFLSEHTPTRAVVVYAEGIRDGGAFLRACAQAAPTKPVVVLKGARTQVGGRAALSHTGAIAGPYDVLAAALRQVGATVVEREDELTPVALALSSQPADARGIVILSDGGGQGTLAADALTLAGVPLATLSAATRTRLESLLGSAAALNNPVDLAGRADAEPAIFAQTLGVLLGDDAVGSVMVVGLFGGYHLRFASSLLNEEVGAAQTMERLARKAGKGLVVHTIYATDPSAPLDRLRQASVPVISSLEAACAAVGALYSRGQSLNVGPHPLAAESGKTPTLRTDITERTAGLHTLTEWSARRLLQDGGSVRVPFVEATRCTTEAEVALAASSVPAVVLKADAEGLTHKTEVGGVALNVASAAASARAALMMKQVAAAQGWAAPVAIIVQPMLPPPLVELLVSVRWSPEVGLVATVGAGGVWTEALSDSGHVALPCREGAVVQALQGLRVAPLLAGARGRKAVSAATLTEIEGLIVRLGVWMSGTADVLEVELNPLFVYSDRIVAADALVVLAS